MKKVVLIGLTVLLLLLGLGVAKLGWHSTWQIVQGSLEDPKKADLANPVVLNNGTFEMSYPRNWRIDNDDPDYDPETYFDINPPKNGKVIIMVQNKLLDLDSLIEGLCGKYRKLMPKQRRQETTKYGTLTGKGVDLRGFMLVADGLVRIFVTHVSAKTLIVVEQRYDEDEVYNKEGYDLIQKTIQLKR